MCLNSLRMYTNFPMLRNPFNVKCMLQNYTKGQLQPPQSQQVHIPVVNTNLQFLGGIYGSWKKLRPRSPYQRPESAITEWHRGKSSYWVSNLRNYLPAPGTILGETLLSLQLVYTQSESHTLSRNSYFMSINILCIFQN